MSRRVIPQTVLPARKIVDEAKLLVITPATPTTGSSAGDAPREDPETLKAMLLAERRFLKIRCCWAGRRRASATDGS